MHERQYNFINEGRKEGNKVRGRTKVERRRICIVCDTIIALR